MCREVLGEKSSPGETPGLLDGEARGAQLHLLAHQSQPPLWGPRATGDRT